MAEYRAGIIGLGFIGAADQVSGDALGQRVEDLDGTHLVALDRHPQVRVVAGSSRDAGRRQRFAQRTGAETYASWQEMLESERLDIVSVATYTPTHEPITLACAAAGVRAVYCEKPVAPTLEAGDRMLRACEEAGALLVFNHQRRFNPNYQRLRDLVAGGGLGALTSVNAQWGSGRLGNVGTHIFDAIGMVTGCRAEAVAGTLDLAGKPDCRGADFSDPGGWGTVRLQGGPMVVIDAPDYSRAPFVIAFNGSEGRALVGGNEFRLEYWDGRRECWPSAVTEVSSMDRGVQEIVSWLDRGGPFSYPAAESLHALEIVVAFHLSHARNSAWVELPLSGAERQLVIQSG
ncbi:MAG: Gfo/Idh/MocA family oxidoreductase [Candidatus Latescibacteria bacterium]|nr:Gfo/Idh/MocA family oxidoreductase [Candidatus Latescibacterota bacterium]